MNDKELMIGDWVYVSENFTQKYHKVRYIDADGVVGCLFVNEYGIECKSAPIMDCVQPIPLTKEILEKNGFVYEEDYDAFIDEKAYIRINIPTETDGAEVSISYSGSGYGELSFFPTYNEQFYVHELQHALRLCGLNDLADNFKI